MTTLADGFLHLLKAEPTLMPPAPDIDLGRAIEHRRRGEVHACLRCGGRAAVAYVAETEEHGNRWLDLCWRCADWLRMGATS